MRLLLLFVLFSSFNTFGNSYNYKQFNSYNRFIFTLLNKNKILHSNANDNIFYVKTNNVISKSIKNNYGLSNSRFLEYMRLMNKKNSTITEPNNSEVFNKNAFKQKLNDTLNNVFDKLKTIQNPFNTTFNPNETYDSVLDDQEDNWDEVGPDNLLSFGRKSHDKNATRNPVEANWTIPIQPPRVTFYYNPGIYRNNDDYNSDSKSKHFELSKKTGISYKDVGGYDLVKSELDQCKDLLINYEKYKNYNIRVPKGLVLDGPPGTGKTLLAKAFATECNCSFIAVSGSDFQQKYVGVGQARIKELFELAKKNIPCIIFIDELDSVGKRRSSDGESSSSERDSTLNALLVEMDGFKNNTGVFVMGATNRIDLLDRALLRPGRFDKKIHIGLPDTKTRQAIVDIHLKGKPHDSSVKIEDFIESSEGLSGAEIENILNEAMLNALRLNNTVFTNDDLQHVSNKLVSGWQPNENELTEQMIRHTAVHEMGHAILAFLSKHYCKLVKVIINLSSPTMLGYTQLNTGILEIYTEEALLEQLMVLFGGRIAEELLCDKNITTGASMDIKQAHDLAKRMVLVYGMGNVPVYAFESEKYKEIIDNEVMNILEKAYKCAKLILIEHLDLLKTSSEALIETRMLSYDDVNEMYKYHQYKKENYHCG